MEGWGRLSEWRWRKLAYVAALMIVGATCAGSLVPAVREAREAARRSQCRGCFSQLRLALLNYEGAYGCFPPAYIADENGRPLHSWRVLILPFIGHEEVFRQYRFDEAWDGPNNRKMHGIPMPIFNCISAERGEDSVYANYLAVVGPDTMWPGVGTVSLSDITDNPVTTVSLVEVANSDVRWMEPRDLNLGAMPMTINSRSGTGISSRHRGGVNVGIVDGSSRFFENSMTPAALRAWLTIRGGEPASAYDL